MNLRWLELFCLIVEEGSISAAGRSAYISQPSVTKYMHYLEEHYGAMLLHRGSGKVTPTEAGRVLYPHAKAIIQDYQNSLESVAFTDHKTKRDLKVGASFTLGEYMMPTVVAAFNQIHDDSDVQVTIQNTRTILKMLEDQQIDLAFVEGEIHTDSLRKQAMIEDKVILVVNPTHPWSKRTHILPQELREERYIAREPKSSTRIIVEKHLMVKQAGLKLEPHLQLNTTQAVKSAVQSGLGYGFLSHYAVQQEIQNGLLVHVPFANLSITRPFWSVVKPLRFEKPIVETFQQLTQQLLKELEPT
ncbi:LysR family transcriptional regulator [Alkalicoccobacillus plakortidis]|uniref:LysR family transcriptional regulator n=1 Tax=Alkalicoccobacillus plakortidis TaxID=444060 RepID=A0ABT0XKD0_9BACI|nr:LysR family transcriptional regulator [Alkalicoccobacillus plakortidis]MCM2675823.1 LysR family transcriptional regulator [Alkalicoccobacillus plakortidis]